MKTIELAPGVYSSVLGFGCAPVQGSVDGMTAKRAIHCALDCGINHFDLARSYGYGEAEAFVGAAVRSLRDSVTLASKFGIRANWKAGLLKPLKPLVRTLKKNSKPGVTAVGSPATVADRFHDRIPLDRTSMLTSLEKSLKACQTDHLDIFFIHEPPTGILEIDDLLAAADDLKKSGKIRAFGIAFNWDSLALHEPYLRKFDVVQFNNSPGSSHYEQTLELRKDHPNVFFSPLRGSSLNPEDTFRKLWIDFPNTVILCSMFKENHIRQNAKSAS